MTGRLRALYVGCALMGIVSLFGIVGAVIHGGGGGVTGWPTNLTTAATTSESVPVKIRGTGGQSTSGWNIYQHSNGTPTINPVCSGVENDCDKLIKLDAGNKYEIQNNSSAAKFTLANDTGVVTNVSIDAEGTGNAITLPFKYNIKPVGCTGTTGTLLLDTNATLAPTPTCLAGTTNTTLMQGYADFPDTASDTQFQDKFRLPADWSGAVDLQLYWKAAATSGDVVWKVATLCRADGEIEDAAWNTEQLFPADTAKGTTLQLNTVSLTGLTTTGCAAGEMFHFKIMHNNATTGDTIVGVVSLSHGELTIRRAM